MCTTDTWIYHVRFLPPTNGLPGTRRRAFLHFSQQIPRFYVRRHGRQLHDWNLYGMVEGFSQRSPQVISPQVISNFVFSTIWEMNFLTFFSIQRSERIQVRSRYSTSASLCGDNQIFPICMEHVPQKNNDVWLSGKISCWISAFPVLSRYGFRQVHR